MKEFKNEKKKFIRLPNGSKVVLIALVLCAHAAAGQMIKTIAGGDVGDGRLATNVAIINPNFVSVDGQGNLYVSDPENHRIRRVDAVTGVITSVVGNGMTGFG